MRLTIIKSDNVVGVDGLFVPVDCSGLPEHFHALQWEGSDAGYSGEGEVEWSGKPKPPNTQITDLGEYYSYVVAWRSERDRLANAVAGLGVEQSGSISASVPSNNG